MDVVAHQHQAAPVKVKKFRVCRVERILQAFGGLVVSHRLDHHGGREINLAPLLLKFHDRISGRRRRRRRRAGSRAGISSLLLEIDASVKGRAADNEYQ